MSWGAAISGALQAAGSVADGIMSYNNNKQAVATSKDFAKNGIKWKVQDAREAGIHPLYALGAQTNVPSFSFSGSNFADGLGAMGQGIGRAIDTTSSTPERVQTSGYQKQLETQNLRNLELRNQSQELDIQAKRAELDNITKQGLLSNQAVRTQQAGPPFPDINDGRSFIAGQGNANSPGFKVKPVEINASELTRPSIEAGSAPEVTFHRTAQGGYAVSPSQAAKDSQDDDFILQTLWKIRNLLPAFGSSFMEDTHAFDSHKPPRAWLPDGAVDWHFDGSGQWMPTYRNDRYRARIR